MADRNLRGGVTPAQAARLAADNSRLLARLPVAAYAVYPPGPCDGPRSLPVGRRGYLAGLVRSLGRRLGLTA